MPTLLVEPSTPDPLQQKSFCAAVEDAMIGGGGGGGAGVTVIGGADKQKTERRATIRLNEVRTDLQRSILEGQKSHISFQTQVYNFLEFPTGWKCFVYHFSV